MINEVSAATLGQPVSVLLVDVGAAIGGRKSKNKEEETHTSSDNLTQNSIQHLGEIENNGNQRRSEVCWGIGDRVCVFIVVCRLLHILAVMKSDRAKLKVIADSERDVEGECEREDEDGTIDYFEEDVRTGQSLFTKYVLKASSDVSTVQDPHSSTSSFPDLSAEEISAKLLADSKVRGQN